MPDQSNARAPGERRIGCPGGGNMNSYAGHSVTITLKNHDDTYPGDPTYT